MAQLVASMSCVILGGVVEVVGSNLARGKIFEVVGSNLARGKMFIASINILCKCIN